MRIGTKNAVFPLGALSTLLCSPALAQTAPAPTPTTASDPAPATSPADDAGKTGGDIVITGSRIARRDYVSESPIVTVGQDLVAKSGSSTIETALNQMPQFTASSTASSNLNSRGGQANADLRGLGVQRTLVLLDGRRMQPSNTDGSVDLNTVPDALLDNVEVITGGASAVYGSDAIAGVVNFKLKEHFSGAQVSAQYGLADRGDGATTNISVALGGNFADGKGNAILGMSYSDRSSVFGADRPFFRISNISANLPEGVIKPSATNLPTQAATNALFAKYGIAAGTVSNKNTFGFNNDGTLYSAGSPALHLTDNLGNLVTTFNNTYYYNTGLIYYLQLPLTRYSIFSKFSYDVTPHIKLYAQGYFTTYNAETQIVPPVSGGTGVPALLVPTTNPFIPADLATLLASRPNPTAPFIFSKRMNEVGNRVQTNDYDVYQLLVGASGDLGVRDWTWDVFASRGETHYTETDVGYPSLSALQNLLNAPDGGRSICTGGYNPFGLTSLSSSCASYLARTIKSTTSIEQTDVEASLQGGLFNLPAGEVRFAAGADYRQNSYNYSPDALLVHLDLVNAQTTNPSNGSTSVWETYGELLVPLIHDVPLIKELSTDVAYRFSQYDTVGSVSTYKASLDWSVVKGLRFRGGYQRAIRAPNLGELFTAPTPGSVSLGTIGPIGSGDPCDVRTAYRSAGYANSAQVRGLCLATGVPSALVDSYTNGNPLTVTASSGNRGLKEEVSDTFTAGVVLRPHFGTPWLDNLSVSVDYYNIKLKDAIGSLTGLLTLSKCFNADGSNPTYSPTNSYCTLISRESATGLISQIQTPLLNLGGYKTNGIDIQADWRLPLADVGLGKAGTVSINVVASYLNSFQIQSLPGGPSFEYAGTIGNTQVDLYADTKPRWKTSTALGYAIGPVSLTGTWRYIDKMANANNVGTTATAAGVPAKSYFDLDVLLKATDVLSLRLGVLNIADTQPPQFGANPGTTSLSTYDLIGRRFYVRATAKF